MSQEWLKHFSFGQENIVQVLCIYDMLIILANTEKNLMVVCCKKKDF